MTNQSLQTPAANFGQLFKFFRIQAGFNTIGQFADALADHNIVYCESLYYHWQRNNKIPTNRQLLLRIIKVFIEHGGITTSNQANLFLESSNKGYLTNSETNELVDLDIQPTFEQEENFLNTLLNFLESEKINKNKPKIKCTNIPKTIRFNFMIEESTNAFLSKVAKENRTTKSKFIRQLIQEYKNNILNE